MKAHTNTNLNYDNDFYAWTLHNAQMIREGNWAEVDIEHIAEELESMGRSDKRELLNRLGILLAHLIKWQHQPERRSNSWKYTIKEQRFQIQELLEDSPSLKAELSKRLENAYKHALLIAVKETGFNATTFSNTCPFTIKQVLEDEFLPEP